MWSGGSGRYGISRARPVGCGEVDCVCGGVAHLCDIDDLRGAWSCNRTHRKFSLLTKEIVIIHCGILNLLITRFTQFNVNVLDTCHLCVCFAGSVASTYLAARCYCDRVRSVAVQIGQSANWLCVITVDDIIGLCSSDLVEFCPTDLWPSDLHSLRGNKCKVNALWAARN